jgi:hypothetical protein
LFSDEELAITEVRKVSLTNVGNLLRDLRRPLRRDPTARRQNTELINRVRFHSINVRA